MSMPPAMRSILIFLLYACILAPDLPSAEAHLTVPSLAKRKRLSTYHQSRQSNSGGGRLSFEQCDLTETACESPRFCRLVADQNAPCSGEGPCQCLPPNTIMCSSQTHCVEGEVCAEVEGFGTVCASESFVNKFDGVKKLPGEKSSPPPFPSEEGLTFDPCKPESCAFPRFCRTIADEREVCTGALTCHCISSQLIFCTSANDCILGEVCATVPDRGDICVSESFAKHSSTVSIIAPPSPSPGPPPDGSQGSSSMDTEEEAEPTSAEAEFGFLCIGVQFLEHLPRDALRFKVDSTALVLCDENGSCATPGHMVQYKGQSMMMVSYCKHTGCKRRMMKVNSPRYQRGMKIPSHTSGLEFTVFAARYGTFTEETVLKAALRLGL